MSSVSTPKLYGDHGDSIEVDIFSPRLPENEDKVNQFKSLCIEISSETSARNSLNYAPVSFPVDNQIALSLTYLNGDLALLSSIWRREGFPTGTARVLNRSYKFPDFRRTSVHSNQSLFWFSTLSAQLEFLRSNNPEISAAFISRQAPCLRFIRRTAHNATLLTGYPWIVDPKTRLVCSDDRLAGCHHHLCYTWLGDKLDAEPGLGFREGRSFK